MYKKILSEEELIAQSKEKEIFYRYFEQIASWREVQLINVNRKWKKIFLKKG